MYLRTSQEHFVARGYITNSPVRCPAQVSVQYTLLLLQRCFGKGVVSKVHSGAQIKTTVHEVVGERN